MIFNLTEMQDKVLKSDNKVNVIACDRGAGATTSLLLKAIINTRDEPFTVMVFLSDYEAKCNFDKLKRLSVLGGWRFSEHSRIATNTDTDGKIKFCSSEFNAIPYGSTILMDRVHHMDKQVVHEVLTSDSKIFVTTQPDYCGQSAYEWDAPLIKDDVRYLMKMIVRYKFDLSKDYKPEIVNIITGYGVKDNPWLSKMYV